MESWRERGYVPDSDEEDGLDSQEKLSGEDEKKKVVDGSQQWGSGKVVAPATAASGSGQGLQSEDEGDEESQDELVEDGDDLNGSRQDTSAQISDGPAGNKGEDQDESERREPASSPSLPAGDASPPSTPRAKQPASDEWDVPDSSPDELQTEVLTTRKSNPISLPPRPGRAPRPAPSRHSPERTPTPAPTEHAQQANENEGVEDSPLSSAPSSLHLVRLDDENEQNKPESQHEDNLEEIRPEDNLENLLPHLEIPDDVLQQLSQPARRSLRERNPIQLHPYLLEDAKYQRLMKAGGIKPVRIAQIQQALREQAAANEESQGQDFANAEPPSSSPAGDFEFPSSPAEPRISERRTRQSTPEYGRQHEFQFPGYLPRVPRSAKRRKVSHPNRTHHRQREQPSHASFSIDNSVTNRGDSAFDIPLSPPRSGSISSAHTVQAQSGFRFPPGFTSPALNTPVTEPRTNRRDIGDGSAMDMSGPNADVQSVSVGSASSYSQPYSDVEDNQEDQERAVRALQRKIKGVLPASWLRLDKEKQKDKISSTQRNRDRAASHRPENAKGVAKKIMRKTDSGTTPNARAQLTSLSHLADDDNDESDDSDSGRPPIEQDPQLTLADVVGFEDPSFDQDLGDGIPEDNRIDDMFLPIRRDPSSSSRTQGAKRHRSTKNAMHTGNERKRPRLKQQTRLTDLAFEGRKTKQFSSRAPRVSKSSRAPRVPRLGILDVPDVVERPRQEQPAFLRIAARQARSRRDRGRQSPTRKFFDLGSRNDTEDANVSLHSWRRGKLRQTRLEPLRRPQVRQPLMDLSTNGRDLRHSSEGHNIQEARANSVHITGAAVQPEYSIVPEHVAGSDVPAPVAATSKRNITSRRPGLPEVQGNKWIVRRNLAITSLKRNTPRPAGLEAENLSSNMSSSSFQRSLSILNQDYWHRRAHQSQRPSLTLDRFLSDSVASATPRSVQKAAIPSERSSILNDVPLNAQPEPKRRQLKKRPPQRLNLDMIERQQPPTILFPDPVPSVIDAGPGDTQPTHGASGGLSGFQRMYTIDFDVAPLYPGTFFHESTFVGSGEFARSLELGSRDMDNDTGLFHMTIGSRNFRWGAWNDTVSSELGAAFEKLFERIETDNAASPEPHSESSYQQSYRTYRSIIKYTTEILSFIDPIDRSEFVRRAHDLVSSLSDHLATLTLTNRSTIHHFTKIASYNAVFANQIFHIARDGLVNSTIASEAIELVKLASKQVVAFLSSPLGMADIRKCLDEQRLCENREVGIRDDHSAVEAYVIARHVLGGSDSFKGCFASFAAEAYLLSDAMELTNSKDVASLEKGWHSLLTTLPFNEIDKSGIVRVGSRFRQAYDNWSVVKQLLRPVLDDYDPTFMAQPISYNNYCRALFHRCFHLINAWGWRDCKPILDTLYDFFAKNMLYNLKHEESFGSPAFLEELDRNPSLEVRPGEPCFQVLLKIIASGLRFMSKIYDKKKIRNSAWRLLPNHGRVYPKEMPIRHEDLDALRNHHDLLCTLYYAVPDGCRPRLEAIKNLVHPASSHRETCDISIRSWVRLIRFKLSTDEDPSGLDPFADWHSYFVTELLKQHSLARKEIEAQGNADSRFSKHLIESTISQNQRQIESLLKVAIGGLQSAVQLAPTLDHARTVVSKLPIKAVMGLFNSRVSRVNTVVSEALQVVITYTQKCDPPAPVPISAPAPAPVSTDDDSQEYGDWSAIEAAAYGDDGKELMPINEGVEHVEKVFHPAVSRLVSNCFGEDHSPEDKILFDVVDSWTSVAQVLVNHKLRHWDNFLGPYAGDSWASLRYTMQTRKFMPQFLASCIRKDAGLLAQCKSLVLGMWISTLVERTSMLKFQHRLTEALLNELSMDPLLENLPFSRDRLDGYAITLEDFSQRRLSLISSLLSNMREHLQNLEDTKSPTLSITKQEYRELIQKLMSSMKANYQELGNSGQSVQGAYVDFVHRVVGFLQQHSREISPVDPFFTDPTSFPLPSTDPSYIVARLKSYEPKLSIEKVARTLIIFVQGVSERAAIDGQQVYLVNQLHASMTDTYESGTSVRPTLRGVLLQCVFPAYLENTFSNSAAWILSLPILQAISRTLKDLPFNMDTTDPNCVSSVLNIICSILQSSYLSLRFIADNPESLKQAPVLITATSLIETITATLPTIDYIDRVTSTAATAISQARAFRPFALFAVLHLRGLSFDDLIEDFTRSSNAFTERTHTDTATVPRFFHETRHSASRELRAYINESWSRHQGKYFFTRRGAHQPQEVGIDPSIMVKLENSPAALFEDAVEGLLRAFKNLDVFDDKYD
ncbi:uncharacterized protein EURHEDRAFT_513590 [Aspergillus ruber CBS 135680]|uniref:Mus7/MMS22 family-domain-containing protein n=1 Tax=Aspergillus ruber (strain CBS 135680) TaxID=1388766 RepID=A0A017SM83_ASPRC|nr:uncharacterized protein EURHEDRAFT_513590 [Aspergillus ruber CBS 135680]EYE97754.1 hypothetical protein EURHEDRAFT_513590 [Aspergillus ruber CBS 135680]